jgi:all-trans-retinol 13,14-reductase
MEEGRPQKKMMDALADDPIEWTQMKDIGEIMIGKDKLKNYKLDTARYKQSLIEQFPEEKESIEKFFAVSRKAAACFIRAIAFKSMPRWVTSVLLNTGFDRLLNKNYRKYAKMTVDQVLRSITTDPDLQTILGSSCGCYGMAPNEAPFIMHAVFFAEEGSLMWYLTEGPGMIPEKISRTITARGGEVRVNAKVEKILIEDGRAVGVELADGSKVRSKNQVISDAGFVKTFRQFVPADRQPTRRMRAATKAPLENGMTGMVLYIGLKGTHDKDFNLHSDLSIENPDMALPETLDGLAAMKAEELSVFISCPSAKDGRWKETCPGKTTLEIFFPYVPWNVFEDLIDENGELKEGKKESYEQFKHDFGQKIWARSRQALICAGASETLPELLDEADFADVGTPLTFHHYLGSDRGAWYRLEHSRDRFNPRNFYLRLRPECDIAGLYLTGEDVCTDGVGGAMFGGYLCAAKILGVKNPMDLTDMVTANRAKA